MLPNTKCDFIFFFFFTSLTFLKILVTFIYLICNTRYVYFYVWQHLHKTCRKWKISLRSNSTDSIAADTQNVRRRDDKFMEISREIVFQSEREPYRVSFFSLPLSPQNSCTRFRAEQCIAQSCFIAFLAGIKHFYGDNVGQGGAVKYEPAIS